ncbi:MAG TPA: glycosyltransferase family A protein [Chitinophagaceae bacterium]|jgi:glycosyltransferase involved in cell wall biosynthesis|nr:glycosyltransferase family A protein [Chitinophagaceae bacterium]
MISIITCAYKPEEEIFKPALAAIEKLQWPAGEQVEYIIIDNAGGLRDIDYVKAFLTRNNWTRVVEETKPGLTQARLRGVNESKGEWLVYFDQDNEPAADYLIEAQRVLEQHVSVGVCGPGNVTVVFTGAVEPWVEKHTKAMMQELHMQQEVFTADALHSEFIPYGTGMIVRRDVMLRYQQKINSAEYSGADRSAGNLNSGGDVQIVFCASTAGYLVGRTPLLVINHLIPPSRSTYAYVRRFSYGNGLETFPVVAEAYPGHVKQPGSTFRESALFIYQCSRELMRQGIIKQNRKMMICKIAALIAFKEGQYRFYDRKLPFIITRFKKMLAL